jgi:hypothetical protein
LPLARNGVTASRRETSDQGDPFFPCGLLRRFCTSDRLRPWPRCRRFTVSRHGWDAGLPDEPSSSAAIADAGGNTDQARCSLVPDNSQNKRCRPASRSSLHQSLEPRRHVLAPAPAPPSWILICSTSLVSWGFRDFGDAASTTSLSSRGNIMTIIANVDEGSLTGQAHTKRYRLKTPCVFPKAGIRSIQFGSDMRC